MGPGKALGQALREFRQAAGLSQDALAARCEFDRSYISLIERGVQSPTVKKVVKIAEVLGVSPSEIVRRMETLVAEGKPVPGKRKEP